MIEKCPRCENENIKEDYKYCPICGIKLETAQEVPVQEHIENIKNLEKLCKPVAEYLKEHYDPHCTVIIAEDYIKLVEDIIGIPVRSDD